MNCKPGVYAYLRGLTKNPQYNGRVVKVLSWDPSPGIWRVEPQWELNDHLSKYEVIRAYDANLLPIGGVPVTDDVTEDLKEPA